MSESITVSGVNITPMLDSIASLLGRSGSDVQGRFMRIFADELVRHCQSHYNAEMQAHAIRVDAKLGPEQSNVFACIGMEDGHDAS